MKKYLTFFLALPTLFFSQSQNQNVGINTPNPQSLLDVTHIGIPNSLTGLLIPTVTNFPVNNPTAAQNGMVVYYKGNEMNRGFYFWDNVDKRWQYLLRRKTIVNNLSTVAYVATTGFSTITAGSSSSWIKTTFDKINTPNSKFKISSTGDIVVGETGTYNLYFTGGILQKSATTSTASFEITITKKIGGTGSEITLQTTRLTTPAADLSDRSVNTTISLNHTFSENDVIIVKTRRVVSTITDSLPSTKYSLILSKLSV